MASALFFFFSLLYSPPASACLGIITVNRKISSRASISGGRTATSSVTSTSARERFIARCAARLDGCVLCAQQSTNPGSVFLSLCRSSNNSNGSSSGRSGSSLLGEGGGTYVTHGHSCMPIDPCIPTLPGRSTSGFH